MTTDEYLASLHLALVDSPIVRTYEVARQRVTSQSGYLRVRVTLTNGDLLESSEFFRLTPAGIEVTDYRHHWMDGSRRHLIRRWDCAPHHPEVVTAPHHCHLGDDRIVAASQPYGMQAILTEIARELHRA